MVLRMLASVAFSRVIPLQVRSGLPMQVLYVRPCREVPSGAVRYHWSTQASSS